MIITIYINGYTVYTEISLEYNFTYDFWLFDIKISLFRASIHEDCPESEEYIRVKDYASEMVVRPHKTFQEVNWIWLCRLVFFISTQIWQWNIYNN